MVVFSVSGSMPLELQACVPCPLDGLFTKSVRYMGRAAAALIFKQDLSAFLRPRNGRAAAELILGAV